MIFEIVIGAIILCFMGIQLVEVASYLARIAGLRMSLTATSYALQNAVYMVTRLFAMLLLPILGLMVDAGVSKHLYVGVCASAIAAATFACALLLAFREIVILALCDILTSFQRGRSMIVALGFLPYSIIRHLNAPPRSIGMTHWRDPMFWMSAVVFSVYSVSLFGVFYFGLLIPDYRTAISQMSGATNALAAVLLTFVIEPRISTAIDRPTSKRVEGSQHLLISLIAGRIFGVFAFGLSACAVAAAV